MMDRQEAIGVLFVNAKDHLKRLESIDLDKCDLTEVELIDHKQYLKNYIDAVNIIGLEVEDIWHEMARMIDYKSKALSEYICDDCRYENDCAFANMLLDNECEEFEEKAVTE